MPAGGVGTIVCSWAFGDITTCAGCSTTRTYAATRSFTANVTAIDGLGVTATGSVSLTVNAKLTVTVAASSNPAEVGSAVDFTAHTTSGVGVATCKWTFGDGATGTGCTTTHTYASQGTFTASVTATDTVNVTATTNISETVNAKLAVTSVASPRPTEVGTAVRFTSTPAGGVGTVTCSWAFGDTTAAGSGCSSTHAYADSGTFTAAVTATDSLGVNATASITVAVNAKLAVMANASPNPTEVGALVDSIAPTTGGIGTATCSWAFGDGGTANTCSASHTYTTIGPFNPTVTVSDALSVTALRSVSVTVNARLTITATAGPNPTDNGVRVGLAPVSAGGVGAITCSWDFGDAVGATGCSTSHTYTSTGTFTATLTATDEVGVTTAASVTITVNPLPSVDFNFEQAKPMAGEPVNFTSITTGGSGPFSFSWNYGDSRLGLGNPVSHSYAAGTFNVTVTVADAVGETAAVTHSVAVTQSLAVSIASIAPSLSEIEVSTSFVATATGGTPTYTFNWDFGDGGPAVSDSLATHTYTAAGTYAVTISSTDSANHTTTSTQALAVNSRLAVTAVASLNPADAGVPVSFAQISTGGVGSLVCNWSFGDGWSANNCNTVHTYATTGSFTVRLTTTDTLSVSASASLSITVTF